MSGVAIVAVSVMLHFAMATELMGSIKGLGWPGGQHEPVRVPQLLLIAPQQKRQDPTNYTTARRKLEV